MTDKENKFDAISRFEDEVVHGLLHSEEYKEKIKVFRVECEEWGVQEKVRVSKLPRYDPDNHIASCGCVVQNGKRIHWCGDHY